MRESHLTETMSNAPSSRQYLILPANSNTVRQLKEGKELFVWCRIREITIDLIYVKSMVITDKLA